MPDQTLTDRIAAAETETSRLLYQLGAPVWCARYLLSTERGSVQLSPSEMATVELFKGRLRARKTFIRYLKSTYDLTIEKFDEMVLNQGGRCAICDKGAVPLDVDHDHSTGKVRQLLCRSCNTQLGSFKDSAEAATKAADEATEIAARATKAAEYLKKHKTP